MVLVRATHFSRTAGLLHRCTSGHLSQSVVGVGVLSFMEEMGILGEGAEGGKNGAQVGC